MTELAQSTQQRRTDKAKLQAAQERTVQANSQRLGADVVQRALHAPHALAPAEVMALQRTVGNAAVQRILAGRAGETRASGPLVIQPKLTVGPADDKYEQEADRTADQVVNAVRSVPALPTSPERTVQRDQEEEGVQMKPLAGAVTQQIQREVLDEEAALQMQAAPGAVGLEGGPIDGGLERAIRGAKRSGSPLPDALRSKMEGGFGGVGADLGGVGADLGGVGADFGSVRVHTGPQADALNRSLNARAFTSGSDIFFKRGEFNPDSAGGQKLLAHELTHTVQQGAVQRKAYNERGGRQRGDAQPRVMPAPALSPSVTLQRFWPFKKKQQALPPSPPKTGADFVKDLTDPTFAAKGPIAADQLRFLLREAAKAALLTYAYHATRSAAVGNITKAGLDPNYGGTGAAKGEKKFEEQSKGRVHYTRNLGTAEAYKDYFEGGNAFPGRKVDSPAAAEVLQIALPRSVISSEELDPDSPKSDKAFRSAKKISGKNIRSLLARSLPNLTGNLNRGENSDEWVDYVQRGDVENDALFSNMSEEAQALIDELAKGKNKLDRNTILQMLKQGLKSMRSQDILEFKDMLPKEVPGGLTGRFGISPTGFSSGSSASRPSSLLGPSTGTTTSESVKTAPPSSAKGKEPIKEPPQLSPLETLLQSQDVPLRAHPIDGDGNCFYASVLHQLARAGDRTYKDPQALRNALADQLILSRSDHVLGSILESYGISRKTAAARIRTNREWNGVTGDIAPEMTANLLGRQIIIYQASGPLTLDPRGGAHGDPLRIVYNGRDHYDSTVNAG